MMFPLEATKRLHSYNLNSYENYTDEILSQQIIQ